MAGSLDALGYSGNKDTWRRFMGPATEAASDVMDKLGGTWEFSCPICGQPNTRGIADHVPSMKHWKALGNKLNWRPPPPEQAEAWDSEWVQQISTPKRGIFLFNHLTGAHCFQDELEGLGDMLSTSALAQQEDAAPVGNGKGMKGDGSMMDAWGGSWSPCGEGMWGKGFGWGKGGSWGADAWGGDAWGKFGGKDRGSPYGGYGMGKGKW